MNKFLINFLIVLTLMLSTSMFSQQSGKLYLTSAGTGRIYDITGATPGTVLAATPTALSVPAYFNTSRGADVSNLAVGYDATSSAQPLVFMHSNNANGTSLFKNGVATGTLPAAIGGLGTNNVLGDNFGQVYGIVGKSIYRVYPTVSAAITITGDATWNSNNTTIFASDTFYDYQNNIYTIVQNQNAAATEFTRYLYKIKINGTTATATQVKQITGPVGVRNATAGSSTTTAVGNIRGAAYLNGFVFTAAGNSTNQALIYRINISTGVSEYLATLTGTDFGNANLDLASVDYFLPFEFNCAGAAFQGKNVFSTGFTSAKTVRIPIEKVYTPGVYTVNVRGTDFTTATQNVTITNATTYIDIPVTYLGTGAAGTRTLTVQLGDSTTECQLTTTVEASFGCNSGMYISQSNTLFNVITTSNPLTFPSIGSPYTSDINAIGLNPLDGMIYGISTTGNELVRINALGQFTSLGATGLVGNLNAGEFDHLGNYYVKNATSNGAMFRIDINTMVATPIALNNPIDIPDFAYNPITQKFYGVNSTNGRLVSMEISGNNATVVDISTNSTIRPFGAMFASSTGEIYGSLNAGGFYQFNLSNGQRTKISDSPASNVNDGAHCFNAPITFSADLYVTKTDASTTYIPGTTTTYTIVAGNTGPFGVQGATVADAVPAGIPAANISYTAAVTGSATTSVVGTQTGAINDLVSLPVGGTVIYTVVVTVPITFSGNLVNNVTIAAPGNIIDLDLTNNSATDTNTEGVCYNDPNITGTGVSTNHGITLLQRAGADNGNWPMVRNSAHTVLESNTKGFVITRMTTAQIAAIVSPQEGMMVFDTDLKCLKINSDSTAEGWACFSTPTCP